VEFLKQNVLLIGLAIGSGLALLLPMLSRSVAGISSLSATEAVMLMNRKSALVLDVREADEFAQGHLQGARHVPLPQLSARIKELEKFRDKPVLVVCERGRRANAAAKLLKAQNFTTLNVLKGGMQAWIEAKMPSSK
jgi:rhodanese-related sulfurtransferase